MHIIIYIQFLIDSARYISVFIDVCIAVISYVMFYAVSGRMLTEIKII